MSNIVKAKKQFLSVASRRLDQLFDEWPWAFRVPELRKFLKATFTDVPNSWIREALSRYLNYAVSKKEPFYVSDHWDPFYAKLTMFSISKQGLWRWARLSKGKTGSALTEDKFFGKNPQNLWARVIFEIETTPKAAKAVARRSPYGLMSLISTLNERFTPWDLADALLKTGYTAKLNPRESTEVLGRLCDFGLVTQINPSLKQYSMTPLMRDSYALYEKHKASEKSLAKCPWRLRIFK